VGAVTAHKLDFELISSVARKRPDWHWVLIGPRGQAEQPGDLEKLGRPNVHVLGPRQYKDLPHYVRGFDVAVLPCPLNEYTNFMFPMKFFEYLAAGKDVVASSLPALQEFADVFLSYSTAEEFIEQVERALDGRGLDRNRCRSVARRHTWEWRTEGMMAILNELSAGKP
jgi:glycosyltransferase involved in cell wall biosynthesis